MQRNVLTVVCFIIASLCADSVSEEEEEHSIREKTSSHWETMVKKSIMDEIEESPYSPQDEDSAPFVLVTAESRSLPRASSRVPCEYGRNCPSGSSCQRAHTNEEQTYFHIHGQGDRYYKTSLCLEFAKGCCVRGHACRYVHQMQEAFCWNCVCRGHLERDCPSMLIMWRRQGGYVLTVLNDDAIVDGTPRANSGVN